jgi:D-alanyl-lipoteichoic acid acyltransferase DltB (MBOAT superfamily)
LAKGLIRLALGIPLLLTARLIWLEREVIGDEEMARWLSTIPLLVGISLLLHFGLFNVLAGMWRALGVDCRPLFRAPLLSTSLNEFWSRRWNLAFSEMTALAVYRPLSAFLGRKPALAAAFIASGLVHELAISVPVCAGYGLPMSYFLLHGLLVLFENSLERRQLPISRHPWAGRLWVRFWLVVPLPILFHRPFLSGIVWPLIGMNGN